MPGQAITTEMWRESDHDVLVQAKAGGQVVISNAKVTLA